MAAQAAPEVVVVGHVGRDMVVRVDDMPETGHGAGVRERLEMPGGKGANQAVGLAQLGCRPALVGAVGDDPVGRWLVGAAAADGIDTTGVIARQQSRSSLIVSVVDRDGSWRYLEDLTPGSFVTPHDVRRFAGQIRSARVVSLQLQQGWDANLEAARIARDADGLVVVDGTPPPEVDPGPLYALADLLRADRREAELATGRPIHRPEEAISAGRSLLEQGPATVALASEDADILVWPDGQAVIGHDPAQPVVDTTGAGDAFVAGMITGLLHSGDRRTALCLAAAAARRVVAHLGGRPRLEPDVLWAEANLLKARLDSSGGHGSGTE